MYLRIIAMCMTLVACGVVKVYARQASATQQPSVTQQPTAAQNTAPAEKPVPLSEISVALDAKGVETLAGRLRTTALTGAPDSPAQNARLLIENRSRFFYTYINGWATFYDAQGVRCGEGMFKIDALAAGESSETDTPGLHLKCTPASWRIAATTLLTRTTDTAKPNEPTPNETPAQPNGTNAPTPALDKPAATNTQTLPRLLINIDGEDHPIQLNNPIKIKVGQKQMTITLSAAP